MMKFKGDIIITDPCYIFPKGDLSKKPRFTDYLPFEYWSKKFSEFTEVEMDKYRQYELDVSIWDAQNPDYWRNGDIDIFTGSGIEKFGIETYLWEDTIYGDWSCTCYQLKDESSNKPISELCNDDILKTLGDFCADAGLVGVFYLNEVLKFNKDFNYHIEKPWTTTLIENFDGEIEYLIDGDQAYIRGKGNINFITIQTGF